MTTATVAIINQTAEELIYREVQHFFQSVSLNLHRELQKYFNESLRKDQP